MREPTVSAPSTVPTKNTVSLLHAKRRRTTSNCSTTIILLFFAIILCSNFLFSLIDGSIGGPMSAASRKRRQTPASSSGTVNAVGNQTSMSASNALWKTTDGTVGANGSSTGTASGPGPSNVVSGSNAIVGNSSASGQNIGRAIGGTQSQSSGSSNSMLNGAQSASQSGAGSASAVGTGDVVVNSLGNGILKNWTQPSLAVGAVGIGGATGNQLSASNTSNTYQMTWNSIFARVSGISISQGENNSQANIDLRAGTRLTNLSVDGLVSSVNDKPGGSSFSLTTGDGTLMNNTAAMNSALVGAVNTTNGGTRLVGASNLESNGTLNNGDINTFGNLRMNGTGPSQGAFVSNSSFGTDGTARAGVAMSGTQMGANKSIGVSDGISATNDGSGAQKGTAASVGRGSLEGSGNLAANGSSSVVSGYQTGKGAVQIIDTSGKSMATNGTPAELRINNQGIEMINQTVTTNASSKAIGKVVGQSGSVDGNSMLFLNRTGGQNGNANIVAQGGGAGPSSAMTDTGLSLYGLNNTVRNTNICGNVNATGDQTYVQSVSNVSDMNRQQSLFNSQNATVNSAGSGTAMASNSATLRRRKRWWQNVAAAALAPPKRNNYLDGSNRGRRNAKFGGLKTE